MELVDNDKMTSVTHQKSGKLGSGVAFTTSRSSETGICPETDTTTCPGMVRSDPAKVT